MEFRVLGPLKVTHSGRTIALPRGKPRALLVTLLLSANRVVTVDRLTHALWEGEPPMRSLKLVQGYVLKLRRALPAGIVVTSAPGYMVQVEEGCVDLHRFETLIRQSRLEGPERAVA